MSGRAEVYGAPSIAEPVQIELEPAPRVSQQWAYRPGAAIAIQRPEEVVVELSASDVSYSTANAPKYVGNYLLGDLLGEGSYGKVKEALNTITHSMLRKF